MAMAGISLGVSDAVRMIMDQDFSSSHFAFSGSWCSEEVKRASFTLSYTPFRKLIFFFFFFFLLCP